MPFWTYMLHCRGGAFYTGHTDNLERRVAEHRIGSLAGFTQGLLPVELVWSQEFVTRDEALAAERRIKGWSRAKKLALIRGDWAAISRLAKGKDGASTGSARTELRISARAMATVLAESARAAPAECCGLLLGRLDDAGEVVEQAVPAANVHPDPLRHFEIDPAALIAAHRAARAGGPALVGYYHSHPNGHPLPSATDCEHAGGDGRVWAIVADGAVNFFRDGPDGFQALPSRLVEG